MLNFVIAIALYIVVFALSTLASAQTAPQKVVVTYSSRSIATIDLFVAQERGFFREKGFDPQLVQVRATAAIAAGEIYVLGSIGSAIRAIRAPRATAILIRTKEPRRIF